MNQQKHPPKKKDTSLARQIGFLLASLLLPFLLYGTLQAGYPAFTPVFFSLILLIMLAIVVLD